MVLTAFLIVQAQLAPAPSTVRPTTVAAFATVAPVIDGRDDDAIWQFATLIDAFRQSVPKPDADPTFRTTARVVYDAHNLYVFMRAYDPHPDSIATVLARRDDLGPSDAMGVLVDGYRDRRTGFELDVNPSGVKADYTVRDDGAVFDDAWDGVWDVATRIDPLGWTAEFRIPLSQLRYPAGTGVFGIYFWRSVKRFGEAESWPWRNRKLPGLVSQFADVAGLDSLAPPERGELLPYVVAKTTQGEYRASLGADLHYALASNVTLNATVNPDFGQVEADPAELNLTQFETFFSERRPFFVEGSSLFTYDINCGLYSCFHEGLFYSRRIGRAPQLAGINGDATSAGATRIIGATKVVARLGGLALGALGSATERVEGPTGLAIEPAARYGVLRATQDFRGGESGIGFMFTGADRDLDSASAAFLHRSAYAGGLDFRSRWGREYVLHGSVHLSRVDGSASAIALTQRSPIHNYQRPDGALTLDTTRTSLSGDDEQIGFDKTGGIIRFQAIYTRRSPGFEVNDVGYLRQADQQTAYGWLNLTLEKPTSLYRRFVWNGNAWWWATTAGLVTDRSVNTNAHVTLNNLWTFGVWGVVDGLGTTFCDNCARGGPALRQDVATATWWDITGDDRHTLVPEVTVTTSSADGGRSHTAGIQPLLAFNASSRFNTSIALSAVTGKNDRQWLGNPVDSVGVVHYTFARLDQTTVSVTFRANYTLSTTLSVQGYVQPFASWGTYTNVRELADPRATDYDARFRPYPSTGSPGGVNAKQLNANVVLRWEYHPGSTIFAVWTQGRQDFTSSPATGNALDNLRGIFDQRADNTFLVKISHWFNW